MSIKIEFEIFKLKWKAQETFEWNFFSFFTPKHILRQWLADFEGQIFHPLNIFWEVSGLGKNS